MFQGHDESGARPQSVRPLLGECRHCQRSSLGSFGVSVTHVVCWSYQQGCSIRPAHMHSASPQRGRRDASAGASDKTCERHPCPSLGNTLSRRVFVYRKWSTGSTLSGQPGSTTYRWPSLGRVTRRWERCAKGGGCLMETRDGSAESVMAFAVPRFLFQISLSTLWVCIRSWQLFRFSCSWCLNWLETSWRKASWRKPVQRFAPCFCLE